MKLNGALTILKSVAPMHWTEEPVLPFELGCRVSGCTRRGDFTGQVAVTHPRLPGVHTEAALLCENHVRMAEGDLLVWDWYSSGGKAVLCTGGIRERPKVLWRKVLRKWIGHSARGGSD